MQEAVPRFEIVQFVRETAMVGIEGGASKQRALGGQFAREQLGGLVRLFANNRQHAA